MSVLNNGTGVNKINKNEKAFERFDLLIVNEECCANGTIIEKDQVVMCLDYDQNYTETELISIERIGGGALNPQYKYNRNKVIFQTKMLRPFSIKKLKLSNQPSSLSLESRYKIVTIRKIMSAMIDSRHMNDKNPGQYLSETAFNASENILILCFGMIAL